MKTPDCKVTLIYPSATFGRIWCSWDSHTLTSVSSLSNINSWASMPATNHISYRIVKIQLKTMHCSNIVNTRRKYVNCFISTKKCFNKNQLDTDYWQYNQVSMNKLLLPNRCLPPTCWHQFEPSRLDWCQCTWAAINNLTIDDLPIANAAGTWPPEDTLEEVPPDP